MALRIALLGMIQGLTEFFPVSSSGHLVIAQNLLGINENVLFLDVFLHIGTILALIVFFFKDILKAFKDKKLIVNIAIVTITTGIIGLTFKKPFEALFSSSSHDTAIQLLINAAILFSVFFFKDKNKQIKIPESLLMGITQAISIIPGISRSGITIASLMARGVNRETAFRFSFLASIPVIIGAFLLEAKDIDIKNTPFGFTELSCGLAASFVFGVIALLALHQIINKQKFHYFGYYCLALGLLLI